MAWNAKGRIWSSFDGDKDLVDLEMDKRCCRSYEHEDLGPGPGQDWWEHRYDLLPNHVPLPQAFGTLDTVARLQYRKGLLGNETGRGDRGPMAIYIGHFSHWYEWGCMLYARFIIDHPPQDAHEAAQLYNAFGTSA